MVAGRMTRRGLLAGGLALAASAAVDLGPLAGTALAGVPGPSIVGCAGWGARANSDIVPVWNQRPVKILVHHTATPNQADVTQGAAFTLARSIQNFHMDRRGWLDTGQHFTVSRGGFAMEGRHRSVEIVRAGRQQVEGAHCTGQNIVAVGIENEGMYTAVDPPPALWNRLRETCAWICRQYGIPPTELYGHRDFKNTACPGDRLYAALPRLRAEVAGVLGQRVDAVVKASWPLLRRGDRGPAVTAAQYLLRDARATAAEPTGVFDDATDAAVRRFQAATGAEEVNGLLGGESWPVLARPTLRGTGQDVDRAVDTLVAARGAEGVPDVVQRPDWQRLLGTGGAPANLATDPPG
jgi:N-acetylmuramoyl-L-alanine amidase/Putative peptidoglycan binding domain